MIEELMTQKKKKKKTNGLRKTRIYLFIFNPKKKNEKHVCFRHKHIGS